MSDWEWDDGGNWEWDPDDWGWVGKGEADPEATDDPVQA
jgi:hypothetical protein